MFLTFQYIIRTRQHGWRALWNTAVKNSDLNQNCSAILNKGMYIDNRNPSTPTAVKIIKFRRHVSQPERRYTKTVAKRMKQLLIGPVTKAHFMHCHDAEFFMKSLRWFLSPELEHDCLEFF